MAKNFIQKGDTITWTNSTGSDVASGDVVVVGTLVCVAMVDIGNGKSGGLATSGVYELAAITTGAFTQGAALYWDATAKKLTTVTTSNTLAGPAWKAKASAEATAWVRLN